jgi:hypothetical protein
MVKKKKYVVGRSDYGKISAAFFSSYFLENSYFVLKETET